MDGQAVHRFRCAGEICAVIADPRGVSRDVGARPTVTCAFGFVGRERHSVHTVIAALHNSASPGNYRDWHSHLLAANSAGLKCRCDYFQVLSRRFALAGSW
jgi:hypothetical protein